jgi:c-di-GMP-binding flagellar brake protein YcgR
MADSNGSVTIDLGASPSAPEGEADVIASFFTPEALYRVKAHAVPRKEQKAVIDLTVEDVERVQRRAVPRAQVQLRAALTAFDGEGDFSSVVGETIDIGAGGCRVRTEKQFPPGSDPTVTLQMPDGQTIAVLAQVLQVRHDEGVWDYRLAFMDLEDADAARLLALS